MLIFPILQTDLLLLFHTALQTDVTYQGHHRFAVKVGENTYLVSGSLDNTILTCTINGVKSSANVVLNGDTLHVFTSVSTSQSVGK